jgi:hypothetical protein
LLVRMSYIILKGRWCDTVLNVHDSTEAKIDYMDSFYGKSLNTI